MIQPPRFHRTGIPLRTVLEHYRRRYRHQDRMVSVFDAVMGLAISSVPAPIPERPKRILLINAGHIGDCIMSTALFPVLRDAYPDAELDFLTGRYARGLLENHPFLTRVHFMEHWRASRSAGSQWGKARRYYGSDLRCMIHELRQTRYDIALDLHAWFPNSIPLMWLARIPVRVGFSRVGWSPLLTHVQHHIHDGRNEIEHKLDLLRLIGVPQDSLKRAKLCLPPPTEEAAQAFARLSIPDQYAVVHPASSVSTKDWTVAGWAALIRNLADRGTRCVVTGAGARDAGMAADIFTQLGDASATTIDAVNKLNWDELMAVLARAQIVYSVDTSIGHAAAAFARPVVSIYGGMVDALHWGPAGARIVTNPVPCAPCFNKRGCSTRPCITGVQVADVEAAGGAF